MLTSADIKEKLSERGYKGKTIKTALHRAMNITEEIKGERDQYGGFRYALPKDLFPEDKDEGHEGHLEFGDTSL